MNDTEKRFADELTNWLMNVVGFKESQFKMSIHYKFAKYGSKLVALNYVDDCVFWYTSEELGKWFMDTPGKRFHINFLGYEHCFMSIII